MSISNRVNVFLERARQLSTSSPMAISKSKSPARIYDDRSRRTNSPLNYHSRKSSSNNQSEKNIITELELMIDDFLKSRYNVSKKLETHKQKELKVIIDLKKTLDYEIERSKLTDFGQRERNYKEKAEKVLLIVKQEALALDKKLAVFKEENLRLKQKLTEKNIEIVDRKINGERMNIEAVISELGKRVSQKGFEREEVTRISRLADEKNNGQNVDGLILQIVGDVEEELIFDISRAINDRKTQFRKNIEQIEAMIAEKKSYAKFLSHKIKAVEEGKEFTYKKNDESLQRYLKKGQGKSFSHSNIDDEIFMVESETKLSESKSNGESLNASGILDQIYQEILQDIE